MRARFKIEHNGQKMLIDGECQAPDYAVGIMGHWSEDHCILDPETEERRPDLEGQMNDADWEKIADKFDAVLNAQPSEFWS